MITIDELYQEYYYRLHHHLFKLVHDPELAHDLVQDVFVKVCKSYGNLRTDEYIGLWLYRIATHTAYDVLRRQRLIAFQSLEANKVLQDTLYSQESVEDVIIGADILKAAKSLKEKDRRIFWLCIEGTYSYQEIADIVGISANGVKMAVSRMRRRLLQAYNALQQEAA